MYQNVNNGLPRLISWRVVLFSFLTFYFPFFKTMSMIFLQYEYQLFLYRT